MRARKDAKYLKEIECTVHYWSETSNNSDGNCLGACVMFLASRWFTDIFNDSFEYYTKYKIGEIVD